jgi:hypothetical protein
MPRKKKTELVTSPERAVSAQTEAMVEPKVERITTATEREAKEATLAIRVAFRKITADWWEIGRLTREALDRQVPTAMGINPQEWMKSVFGDTASIAKIQRSLRIVRALKGIPEEQIHLLTEGKAYLLTQVKEKDRAELLDQAIVVTNEQFEQIVEEKRAEYGIPPSEERVHVTFTVAKTVAEQWYEAEKKIARLAEIDIELKPARRGEVLEIVAAMINTTPDEVLTAEAIGGETA